MAPFNREEWHQHIETVSNLRSGYIELTIQIEDWLDRIIQSIITPEDGSGSIMDTGLVRTVILQDHAVSFDTKIRMFRRMSKIKNIDDYEPLAKRIDKVKDNRNMLAHAESEIVSGVKGVVSFTNLKPNGEFSRVVLQPEDIEQMNKEMYQLESDMFHLYSDLNPWLAEV
jgi:hypothetical protein